MISRPQRILQMAESFKQNTRRKLSMVVGRRNVQDKLVVWRAACSRCALVFNGWCCDMQYGCGNKMQGWGDTGEQFCIQSSPKPCRARTNFPLTCLRMQAIEKIVISRLLVENSNRRIFNVDRHAGMVSIVLFVMVEAALAMSLMVSTGDTHTSLLSCNTCAPLILDTQAVSGLLPDGRQIVNRAKAESSNYKTWVSSWWIHLSVQFSSIQSSFWPRLCPLKALNVDSNEVAPKWLPLCLAIASRFRIHFRTCNMFCP